MTNAGDRPDLAIKMTNLRKVFSRREKAGRIRRRRVDVEAVAGVSLTVERGELVGYLGPNGAGKSTTIKMLTGILQPTSGEITVAGLEPLAERKALARNIGVVFGQRSNLWWDLPVQDSFDLLRHIYRVPAERFTRNVERYTELFDLAALRPVPVRQLSLGQRMRVELAAVLLHDPEVLFLDEPTIGLDVVSKHAVREALTELHRDAGLTIVLTTHDLGDVERLCERIVIIDHGTVISDGTLKELIARHGRHRTLVVDSDSGVPLDPPGLEVVRVEGPRHWLRFDSEALSAAEAVARVMAVAPVQDLTIEEPAIEEIVRRIYAGEAS
jgi:ABC-2 type transport system ATP-binding protein